MNIRKICSAIILCAVAITTTAQSFESLKRSKGKSALYTTVEKVLSGKMPASDAANEVSTSTQLTEPYNGKTPIYLVLEYLAHTPKDKCEEAEKLLDAFLANKKFDVNQRYSSLMPPLAYLIRENYDFLNERFSAAYISDNVLRKLIEAGASVNTYNTDGSSLMTFASSTRNKYLQDYFLKQGIDLAHRDKAGNDDAYHIISDGNVELLKRLIDEGRIEVEFKKLRNDIKDIAKHPAMYNYLAGFFAKQVNNYDEVTLFRKQFGNNKDLVQNKYEALAKKECNAAKTFNDVLNIEKRYPELTTIIGNYKRAIYDRDCSSLKSLYQRTLEVAKASSLQTMDDGSKNVNSFIDSYKEYDPASLLPLAREMQQFFTVCEALNTNTHYTYWYQSNESSIFVGDYKKFYYFSSTVKYHRERLSNAKAICKGSSKYGYSAFYAKVASQLPIVEQKMEANIARNRDEYSEAQAAYEKEKLEKLFSSASSSGGGSSRNSRSEESSVDIESIPTPKYKTEGPYDLNAFDSFMGLSGKRYIVKVDDGDDDYEIEIFLYKDTKGAWVDGLGSHGIPKQYDTFDNAVTAGYVYYKYGKVREKGEL